MAFNLQLDLFGAIEKFIEFRKVNEWFKLIMSLVWSFWLSGSFSCGTALIAHRPVPESVGVGLVMGAVMSVVVWRRSPLTNGMILALPAGEAKTELESDTQVITKG